MKPIGRRKKNSTCIRKQRLYREKGKYLLMNSMAEKIFKTDRGPIHYWVSESAADAPCELVFLPGLTADHRLFERQTDYFGKKYRSFVWNAPGHASSWPFQLTFSLEDKAKWLNEILELEGFRNPVIVGQSMGGYLGQMFSQLFPDKLRGFVSVDSAPLQRTYYTAAELWLLKRMEPVYRHYPWKLLVKQGTNGVSTTAYGRNLMRSMMLTYAGDQERYAALSGHGFRILASAVEANLPYELKCPALLLCGDRDHAGSCIRYSRAWHERTQIPLVWIKGAGHNSNTDAPELVNQLIDSFAEKVCSERGGRCGRS